MHFPMVVNWREKKECGHDAKEGADMDSVHSAVPLKSVGLNLLDRVDRGFSVGWTPIPYFLGKTPMCPHHLVVS